MKYNLKESIQHILANSTDEGEAIRQIKSLMQEKEAQAHKREEPILLEAL
ncbi:MAG: hypothetical protein IPK03_12020 [Bacteroidetes bacterium]|nr:hypothetical protein [Bacteroidota bacterium]